MNEATTIRFSEQDRANLAAIKAATGLGMTAAIRVALELYARVSTERAQAIREAGKGGRPRKEAA